MTEWEHLAVCSDCLRAAANGIGDPYAVWEDRFVERWHDANRRHGRELVAVCPEPDHGDTAPYDQRHGKEFSWSPCDWCGDTLGGSRYCAAVAVAD